VTMRGGVTTVISQRLRGRDSDTVPEKAAG